MDICNMCISVCDTHSNVKEYNYVKRIVAFVFALIYKKFTNKTCQNKNTYACTLKVFYVICTYTNINVNNIKHVKTDMTPFLASYNNFAYSNYLIDTCIKSLSPGPYYEVKLVASTHSQNDFNVVTSHAMYIFGCKQSLGKIRNNKMKIFINFPMQYS